MEKEIREIILRLFAMKNEGDIYLVKMPSKEIIATFNPDIKEKIENALDSLVLDELLFRDFNFDEEDYLNSSDFYYSLSAKGLELLRELFQLEKVKNPKLNNLQELVIQFEKRDIVQNRKDDYINTINEIKHCFSVSCYNATIALCGKLIEIYLTELLTHFNIKVEIPVYKSHLKKTVITTDLTLGQLLELTSNLPDNEKTNYINIENINLIRKFRNGSIHYKETIPIPSIDQTEGILSFTIDTLKRRLSYDW